MYGDLADSQSAQETLDGTNRSLAAPFEAGWRRDLKGKEKRWLDDFAAKLQLNKEDDVDAFLPEGSAGDDPQQSGIPWWLTRPLMEVFVRGCPPLPLQRRAFSPRWSALPCSGRNSLSHVESACARCSQARTACSGEPWRRLGHRLRLFEACAELSEDRCVDHRG